ncbi:MAG TPA: hypothetical protein VMC02_08715 [Steroidobacteraceae bacterium]|nr:hypothetical protein [Steroidobacteraceae bacterium]
MGVIWAAVLLGFVPDLPRYFHESPPPPSILHFHAAVFFLWLILVTLQILWIETRKFRLHRQMGWLTVGVSALMVPSVLIAALVDQARQVGHPDYAPQFLATEFAEAASFCILMTAGVIFRRNPPAHKRLMLLSVISISDAGSARIFLYTFPIHFPGVAGFFVQAFWGNALILIAIAAWDFYRRGRLHPAVLYGAALIWTVEITATILNFSPTWHRAMARLVSAWGHAG